MYNKFRLSGIIMPAFLFAAAMTGGWSKKIYVPIERTENHRDTIIRFRERSDTIIDRDSVIIRQNGDSVEKTVIKWRTRVRIATDTVYRAVTDSIIVPEVAQEFNQTGSRAHESAWDRTVKISGYILLGGAAALIMATILKLFIKRRL